MIAFTRKETNRERIFRASLLGLNAIANISCIRPSWWPGAVVGSIRDSLNLGDTAQTLAGVKYCSSAVEHLIIYNLVRGPHNLLNLDCCRFTECRELPPGYLGRARTNEFTGFTGSPPTQVWDPGTRTD